MEWEILKSETKELIANSLGIYYALEQKNNLYRKENIAYLSLYCGVLRMGKNHEIKSTVKIGGSLLAGLPIEDRPKYDSSIYEIKSYNYNNVVCQILNEYGINIEKIIELLDLNKKLLYPVSAIKNNKIESQYQMVYQTLLHVIRDYYIASARIEMGKDKSYCPEIGMTVPNIISAIHYPNIDPYCTIVSLYSALGIESESMAKLLEEIEKYSTYQEGMVKYDKKIGSLNIYEVSKSLVIKRTLGKIY